MPLRAFTGWHDTAFATLIGAAFTFVGSLVTIWLKDRSPDQRHIQYLDKATKYLSFWEQYARLEMALGGDPVVASKLRSAAEYVDVSVSLKKRREVIVQVQPKSWLRRWLLLYKPVRLMAWLPRFYFYVLAGYGVIALFGVPLMTAFLPQSTPLGILEDLGLGVSAFVAFESLASIFRALSRLIEGPRPLTTADMFFAKSTH